MLHFAQPDMLMLACDHYLSDVENACITLAVRECGEAYAAIMSREVVGVPMSLEQFAQRALLCAIAVIGAKVNAS